jgi:hypothetical protein
MLCCQDAPRFIFVTPKNQRVINHRLTSVPVSTPEGGPSSRGLHSMTAVGSHLYIFAGVIYGIQKSMGMFILQRTAQYESTDELKLALITPAGAPKDGPMLEDLWQLELTDSPTWRPMSPSGRKPSPRCSHTAVALDGNIIYYGGAGTSRP